MNNFEAQQAIKDGVKVSRQQVLLAKVIILSAAKINISSSALINKVLEENGILQPDQVVIHSSVDTASIVKAVIHALSWKLAAGEAIWSLIHSGYLLPMGEVRGDAPSIGWTTVVAGSGGESSGWRFEDFTLPVPERVRIAPSAIEREDAFLSEPDLYINSLGIDNLHPEVSSSFVEAVKCFRAELYTASLAMLGKASEGAWLELGESLMRIVPLSDKPKFAKFLDVLENPTLGTIKKIEAVLEVYRNKDVYGPLYITSGVRPSELKAAATWSDTVRESRNNIHFGVEPALPNTYEKIAALLIGAVTYIRVLYRVKAAADNVAS